jgi:hypothetical protein
VGGSLALKPGATLADDVLYASFGAYNRTTGAALGSVIRMDSPATRTSGTKATVVGPAGWYHMSRLSSFNGTMYATSPSGVVWEETNPSCSGTASIYVVDD